MKQITVDHTWIETATVDGAAVERERTVRLIVAGPSNLRMGMRRSLLIEEQRKHVEQYKDENPELLALDYLALELLRVQMYPSLVAAVISQEGFEKWPITFEEFLELPEELGIKWEAAVGELNPHWIPQAPVELEEARKKAMNGTPELSNG